MIEIGGFFELELNKKIEFHSNAIKLNSGRSALYFLLSRKRPSKIYLPFYVCESVLEPITMLEIPYAFYEINSCLEPVTIPKLQSNEMFLYINYFGLKSTAITKMSQLFSTSQLIIDSTQAFYAKPIDYVHTFYSPRKFFGVADGGYLYSDIEEITNERNISYKNCYYLLKRIDRGAQNSYNDFLRNEESFSKITEKKMSILTETILKSIDYAQVANKRRENFLYLHQELNEINLFNFSARNPLGNQVPMIYPLYIKFPDLRQLLINKCIYVATYWKEVLTRVPRQSCEYNLTEYLVPLPIDQRYGLDEMCYIVKTIREVLNDYPSRTK